MKDILHTLFEKYLAGTISEQELKELLGHFDKQEIDNDLIAQIRNILEYSGEIEAEDTALAEEVRHRITARLYTPKRKLVWLSPTAVAAAVLLLSVSISIFYLYKREQTVNAPVISASDSVEPGSGKAVLTLSDGSKILLTDSSNSVIKDKTGRILANADAGSLNYVQGNHSGPNNNHFFNTVEVPLGGHFKIVLPDGSIAHLNAGSSLRYAEDFGTRSRVSELRGEGYFEVVKNKKIPFTVKSANLEVTALGTQFNVNTYSDEPFGAATLVEGSLLVQDIRSQKTVILTPGEQAISAYGKLKVQAVHTEDKTAWKDGLFVIDKASLAEVMRQVERWYNVTIVGEIPVTMVTVSGEFPRSIRLEDLLSSLERTTGVKFKIRGRRIEIR